MMNVTTPSRRTGHYTRFYRHVLWPSYEKLRGRQTHVLLRIVEANQWQSADAVLRFQWNALQYLLRHAEDHCAWHRARFQRTNLKADAIQTLAEFRRLPTINRTDIREHREEMLADNYRNRVFMHRTGGSTGMPLQFYMTRESYEWRNAIMARGYGWAGACDGEKTFYLWGVPLNNPTRLQQVKTRLNDWLLRRRTYNSYRLTRDLLPHCLESLNRFAPRLLIGYTSMLEYLARYIRKYGGLRAPLRAVITTAEGLNTAQRQLMKEAYQCPVFHSYGSREFKLIAIECEKGGLHLSADNLLVECLHQGQPAARGQLGEVVITDLHNFGMPFLRYEIGDLASPGPDSCPCGRGLPLLQDVYGRIPDTIQTPDGLLIHGTFFGQLLMWFPCIDQFQVIQKQLDRIEVRLVPADPATARAQLSEIKAKMHSILGHQIQIVCEFCDEIPVTASGKHRVVISEIPVQI